jgi:hypothetical protein
MSHTLSGLISCPQIQEDLNLQFTRSSPLNKMEPQGFTDFVLSPLNTNGTLQNKVSPGGGKKRKVELVYTPPILESEIGTNPIKKCTSDNEAGQLSEEYELGDDGVSYDEYFDLTHMAEMCKSNGLWFAERLQAIMDGLYKKIGTINAQQLLTLYGKFGTAVDDVSSDIKTIATKKASALGGGPDIDALAEIEFASLDTGYGGTPYIFGFGEIYKYYKKVAASCCASDGLDLSTFAAQNSSVFVSDKKIDTVWSGDFATMIPGAVQFLSWLEFEGENGINVIDTEVYKQTVITDPRTGLRYDLQLKNDCGKIIVNLKLVHKLVGLPDDMYSVGDPFRGIKFVNRYRISNPA